MPREAHAHLDGALTTRLTILTVASGTASRRPATDRPERRSHASYSGLLAAKQNWLTTK